MRAVVQRVSRASVTVGDQSVGKIEHGLLVLLGVSTTDSTLDARAVANKVGRLRIFRDGAGKMNRSVQDVDGSVLVVSQFTLYGATRRGNRPSFTEAAAADVAEPLVDEVADTLRAQGITVATGMFGAMMDVELVNDGPVTLMVESSGGRIQ